MRQNSRLLFGNYYNFSIQLTERANNLLKKIKLVIVILNKMEILRYDLSNTPEAVCKAPLVTHFRFKISSKIR